MWVVHFENATMYKKILGRLIYLTIMGPNLNYIVGLERQLMQLHQKPFLDGVRHTLHYVMYNLDYALFYAKGVSLELYGYKNTD